MTNLSDNPFHITLHRAALLVGLAVFASGSTCADVGVPAAPNCVVDDECNDDQVCFDGQCAETCVSDDDCSSTGVCRSELRSEQDDVVDVCVEDDVDTGIDMECRVDADCDAAFPGRDARCAIDGTCYLPAFSILVRDTTPVDLAVPAEDGGFGADIVAIYLRDPETGEPTAWAETLSADPANDVVITNAPDGTRPRLTADGMCSERPYEQAATPLGGEGGTLLVRFLETTSGDIVSTPPASWDIVVVEWGANCPGGELGSPDSFEVYACAASTHRATNSERDCAELLGASATGGVFTIAATR